MCTAVSNSLLGEISVVKVKEVLYNLQRIGS